MRKDINGRSYVYLGDIAPNMDRRIEMARNKSDPYSRAFVFILIVATVLTFLAM